MAGQQPTTQAQAQDRGERSGAAGFRQKPERPAQRLGRPGAADRPGADRRRRRPDLYRPPLCRNLHPGAAGLARHHRRIRAVRHGLRHHAACQPERAQSAAQGGGRQCLRRHRGHRPVGPRVLRQRHLSRPDRGDRRQRRAADRAGLRRRSRRLRIDLPPAQGRARGPPPAGGGAHSRRHGRGRALAAPARAPARREQARRAHDGVVDRRRDARPRAPGKRVPGAPARHRLSRSRAGRLLLGRCGGIDRLSQCHAGELARSRSRPSGRRLAQA